MMDADLVRREHYLDVSGPRDWSDSEVARWVLALCFRRDGRTDAVVRANEIIPRRNTLDPTGDLQPRERGALASAMYAMWSSELKWPVVRIARVFNVQATWAYDVITATASDVADHAEFRAGLSDICLAICEAMLERARG